MNFLKKIRGHSKGLLRPSELLIISTRHVECVVLLSKLNNAKKLEVEINLDELDLTSAESKATYKEIKEYILDKHNIKVSTLYIAQVKRKHGTCL